MREAPRTTNLRGFTSHIERQFNMSNANCNLSVSDWLKHLDYDQETGVFTWKTTWGRRSMGAEAGTVLKFGYRMIGLFGVRIYAHRLAWMIVNGDLGDKQIDHINGDRLDNRISNLRLVSVAQNMQNLKKSTKNTTGFKGVSFYKAYNKFCAEPKVDGKKYFLGYFDTPEEAHNAYVAKKIELTKYFNPHRA